MGIFPGNNCFQEMAEWWVIFFSGGGFRLKIEVGGGRGEIFMNETSYKHEHKFYFLLIALSIIFFSPKFPIEH
jgi:hypothetical protein